MKKTAKADVRFFIFDHVGDPNLEYFHRYEMLSDRHGPFGRLCVKLEQLPVSNPQDLDHLEQKYLDAGYEGVMLRAFQGPRSRYKFGRSTAKEGTLLKVKRFSDKEAIIVGVEEEMQNNNKAKTNELGRTKRSSHQENKSGKGRLGALVCKTESGVEFNIGTGFDADTRQRLWDQRADLIGQLTKYKSFDIGVVDAPRFPVYLGLRSPLDV